ncbi:MMPL family transporter [Yinghuangia soli]|uniref:MMPL family transporter n=1 Tax=Yinghuangia soli TaxID=2908204 RepID=A0AA41U436_9ACTN|nr:MMPL family transporter [Yinghuangia soli]MCF2532470.1 MMPL family transporter [Yinghuangia soli]
MEGARMFAALGRLTTSRPRLLLLFGLLFLVGVTLLGRAAGGELLAGGNQDPASQSARAAEVLERDFPGSRPNLVLLVSARDPGAGGLDAPAVAEQARGLGERLARETGVSGVASYWTTGAPTLRTADGRTGLVVAHIAGDDTASADVLARITPAYGGAQGGLDVRIGGSVAVRDAIQDTVSEDLLRAEMIALPITLLVLVLVFGSAVAALLTLGVGIFAMLGTGSILRLIASTTEVSVFAQNLTTVLGLGLAVDYALFIVRRYREELAAGATPQDAVRRSLNTAGRTVVFSALTLMVSLAAMLVFPLYFLRSFAYAGIPVVALAAFGALVLLPAALLVLGRRVDAGDLRKPMRRLAARLGLRRTTAQNAAENAAKNAADNVGAKTAAADPPEGGWYRLAQAVTRRAPLVAVATTVTLVVLGLPFTRIEFGTADDRQLPAATEARQVQQAIRDGVDGRPTGAVEVIARGAAAADAPALRDYAAALSRLDGTARVVAPTGTFQDGVRTGGPAPADAGRFNAGAAYLSVVPDVDDLSARGQELVRQVRAVPAPYPVLVGGQAAELVDSKKAIGDRLWIAGAVILLATFVLVFLLSGSVLLPLLSILFAGLSLTAMFGAVVLIVQDGHLSGLLGFTPTGSVETALPVLMFCIAFGLSMDYGVFLLSRVKEEYDRTGDHRTSIAVGLSRTGGIITAAAVVLAVVMGAIGTSRVTNTMMLGGGLALAILVDAFVVRSLLVPAVLALTGRATWWAPPALRRLHERFGFDEHAPADPPIPTPAPEPAPALLAGHGTRAD